MQSFKWIGNLEVIEKSLVGEEHTEEVKKRKISFLSDFQFIKILMLKINSINNGIIYLPYILMVNIKKISYKNSRN